MSRMTSHSSKEIALENSFEMLVPSEPVQQLSYEEAENPSKFSVALESSVNQKQLSGKEVILI